jgi:hypothetical protein
MRVLSFTEVDTLLTCQAQHDFQYGDQLAGSSLRVKQTPVIFSAGRAWGAAVAAWHSNPSGDEAGRMAAEALVASLDADAEEQREQGTYEQEVHQELAERLMAILVHYVSTAERVQMDEALERELFVPIPSRGGVKPSSLYRFVGYLDATETMGDGRVWINEFKLRNNLTPATQIVRSRQIRWYAWAFWKVTGVMPAGVWVNERLHQAPKLPRMVQGRKKSDPEFVPSHAKDQLCTADAYEAVCREYGVEPSPEALATMRARKWQQRVPVMFRQGELEAAGRELVSAAQQIAQFDAGNIVPLRNVKKSTCDYCRFKEICEEPMETETVEMLFNRRPPKRELNNPKEQTA